jgi:hypothetical protein
VDWEKRGIEAGGGGTGIILTYNSSQQEALDVVREIEEKALKPQHYSLTSAMSPALRFHPTSSGNAQKHLAA